MSKTQGGSALFLQKIRRGFAVNPRRGMCAPTRYTINIPKREESTRVRSSGIWKMFWKLQTLKHRE